MRSSLEIHTLATGQTRVVLQTDALIEAPNWHPEGWLMVNGNGRLYRVPLATPSLIPIDTGTLARCNNDHGFTRDGREILFSCHRDHGAEIFRLPLTGPRARLCPTPPRRSRTRTPDRRRHSVLRQERSVGVGPGSRSYGADRAGTTGLVLVCL